MKGDFKFRYFYMFIKSLTKVTTVQTDIINIKDCFTYLAKEYRAVIYVIIYINIQRSVDYIDVPRISWHKYIFIHTYINTHAKFQIEDLHN